MDQNKETRYWRDASDRLVFDLPSVDSIEYPSVCARIIKQFGLVQESELVVGPDQMFWSFRRDAQVVSLDWDIWMEFMVTALSPQSEPLVQEIAEWITANAQRK